MASHLRSAVYRLRPIALRGYIFCVDSFDLLPEALRLMRRFKGLSLAEAARRAGMQSSQLSKYENGRVVPELPQLARILSAYGATLFDLATILAALRAPERALVAAAGADEIREGAGTLLLREGGMLVPVVADHLLGEIVARLQELFKTVREVEVGRALRDGLGDRDDSASRALGRSRGRSSRRGNERSRSK